MPPSDCTSRLFPNRKCCLAFIFLSQLTWILPFSLFFLARTSFSSTPRTLILEPPSLRLNSINSISSINSSTAKELILTRGFAGPLTVFGDAQLDLLTKIQHDWGSFWPAMRDKLVARGFVEPSEKSCFMWLPECYALAKHDPMLEIVTSVIGSKVLLYAMTVWHGQNEVLEQFHRDPEAVNCDHSLNVLVGSDVQVIGLSHKMTERTVQALLKNIHDVQEESLKITNPGDRSAFIERSLVVRAKKFTRTGGDVRYATVDGLPGDALFFHGKAIYRISEASGRGALLLQFVSADCKVRDPRSFSWGSHGMQKSLYMPPVLLVSGDRLSLRTANDVRLGLVSEEVLDIADGGSILDGEVDSDGTSRIKNITVYPEPNSTSDWQDLGIWKFKKYGAAASTSVLSGGRFDQYLFGQPSPVLPLDFKASAGEQVIVIVRGGMLYFRAVGDDGLRFCELLELAPGSAIHLSDKLLHALVPSSPRTAFVSVQWSGNEMGDDVTHSEGFTSATEGRTVSLSSGQAYDPDNEDCDVIVVMVEGRLLQILPSNTTVEAFEVILIPAGESCLLWNIGGPPVKFFAMHLCRFDNGTNNILIENPRASTSFGASGKIIRKSL